MDTTITIPASVTPEQVTTARDEFVGALSSSYGAGRRYAAVLVGLLGTAWITMPHDQKGAEGDAMRAERDALYASLKAAGHTNPSVKWKQIKGYATELTAEPEPEAEPSGGKKEVRGPHARLLQDLTELHRFCKREEKKLNDAQKKAATHIASALIELGAVLSTL